MKKFAFIIFFVAGLLHQSKAQDAGEARAEKHFQQFTPRLGVKMGYNIAKLKSSTTSFSPEAAGGFHVSAFYAPPSKGLGYRTELVFSRQGFAFSEDGSKEDIVQDYVHMPHLTTLTIAKKLQLQAGGQIGYLLGAKKESSSTGSERITDFMNRLDYGAALGVEVYPLKGFIIGARYNISISNPYKTTEDNAGPGIPPPFPLPVNPADFKGKHAVIQLSAGYRF